MSLDQVSLTGRHKLIWSPTNHKAKNQKMNILVYVDIKTSYLFQEIHYTFGPSWQQIHLHFESASYLLIVDYTSMFPVVHKLSSMTGQRVANQCILIFSEYGWSETFNSDNGPCYSVEAFTSVMNAYHVNHITRSPHYLQSNRLAEKYVQIVKRLFHKAKEEGKDLFKCLMIYHNTPLSGSLQSPM